MFKDPGDVNGLAVIDRAVGQLKSAMFKTLQSKNTSVWIDKLEGVIDSFNQRPLSALGGAQADDVEGSDTLKMLLLKRNTSKLEKSALAWQRARRGLEVGSKFRIPLKRLQRGFRRGAAATFSAETYTVREFRQDGRQVVADEDGKVYSTKLVQAVPEGTAETAFRALERAQQLRTARVRQQWGKG